MSETASPATRSMAFTRRRRDDTAVQWGGGGKASRGRREHTRRGRGDVVLAPRGVLVGVLFLHHTTQQNVNKRTNKRTDGMQEHHVENKAGDTEDLHGDMQERCM